MASDKLSFLPYQKRWLDDASRIKIWEKSRRIGATYIQAYEDVRDCIAGTVPSVWFSSADLTAAAEYIQYCAKWAKAYNMAAKDLGEVILDEKKGVKAYALEFPSGRKIHALSSNPSQFRSKGGKVVLDEFAFHDDPDAMWAAARPCITWGFPLRILSTHNGKSCKYFKFVDGCKSGKLKWSLHTTDIFLAVKEGLADKIYGKTLTDAERQEWINQEHESCGDENAWQQEYCCNAIDEATAFLTYAMLDKCEMPPERIYQELERITSPFFFGYDVARRRNFSVLWGLEPVGLLKMTRFVYAMQNWKFALQRELLYKICSHKKLMRGCIDETGIGMQLAEEAQDKFGKFRIERVTFTNKAKEEMATQLYTCIEDVAVRIPNTFEIREDLHSVRKFVTAAGNTRYDAAIDTKTGGHADHFWALALANHAISNDQGPIKVTSGCPRESQNWADEF